MVNASSVKRCRVRLSDYPYREDIENRLAIADFTVFEVAVLKEILNHAPRISIADLAFILEVPEENLLPALGCISKTRILTYTDELIFVDKERRRYFESQMDKFDDLAIPGYDLLFSTLRRVPIHVLPDWYSVSPTSNDIFSSIVEQYLATPKVYERHLAELQFSDSASQAIVTEVFGSPDYKVTGAALRKKLKLSRERFEELLLSLELQFVCCVSYNRSGDRWEEVVTPFREWRDYMRFQKDSEPHPIEAVTQIKRTQEEEFAFVKDLASLLKDAQRTQVRVSSLSDYSKRLVDRAERLGLAEVKRQRLFPTPAMREWELCAPREQALQLYRLQPQKLDSVPSEWLSEKALREMERSLKRVAHSGWVYFEDFVRGLNIPIGRASPVALKQTGKRWRYELPQYAKEEMSMLEWAILQRFYEAGFVSIGYHKQKPCFCVSPFGRYAIGE